MASQQLPFIPETITVHLGLPDQPAENVTVSFPDYIKNVASSEIYPTWPEETLRANIIAIVSFTLNILAINTKMIFFARSSIAQTKTFIFFSVRC